MKYRHNISFFWDSESFSQVMFFVYTFLTFLTRVPRFSKRCLRGFGSLVYTPPLPKTYSWTRQWMMLVKNINFIKFTNVTKQNKKNNPNNQLRCQNIKKTNCNKKYTDYNISHCLAVATGQLHSKIIFVISVDVVRSYKNVYLP